MEMFATRRPRWPLALGMLTLIGTAVQAQTPTIANQKPMIDAFVERTKMPRSAVVVVKPDIVIGLRNSPGVHSAADKLTLQGEVVDPDAVARLGYQSMRSLVAINCETRRDRVVEMEVFSLPNLRGTSQKRALPGGWVQPSEDAYMADVIRLICKPTSPQPVVNDPISPPPQLKPTVDLGPRPKPASVPPPQTTTPKPVGTAIAQIGSVDSEAAAKSMLKAIGGLIISPLVTRVETALVGGRTYYRAQVTGFSSRSAAASFCVKIVTRGGSCISH